MYIRGMREAVRCEKRRSFPEGKRSFRDAEPLKQAVRETGRRHLAGGRMKGAGTRPSRCSVRNEAYCLIFKALEKFRKIRGEHSPAPQGRFYGWTDRSSPREWFGINFVTISDPGVSVCSI